MTIEKLVMCSRHLSLAGSNVLGSILHTVMSFRLLVTSKNASTKMSVGILLMSRTVAIVSEEGAEGVYVKAAPLSCVALVWQFGSGAVLVCSDYQIWRFVETRSYQIRRVHTKPPVTHATPTLKMCSKVDISTMNAVINTMPKDKQKVSVVAVQRAWNDGERGVTQAQGNGACQLSSVGANITDVHLACPDGGVAPFIKPENHDEYIGMVDPNNLFAVDAKGQSCSLKNMVENLNDHISYMGFNCSNLPQTDLWGFRSQSAWISTTPDTPRMFSICAVNYNTYNASDPKNLLLVCTPTGIYAHVDVVGSNKLHAHVVEDDGSIMNHYYKAHPTNIAVGDTEEAGQKRSRPGELPSSKEGRFGFKTMPARNDLIMVVSIPLKQQPPLTRGLGGWNASSVYDNDPNVQCVYRSLCDHEDEVIVATASAARLSLGDAVGHTVRRSLSLTVDTDHPPVVTMMSYAVLTAKHGTPRVTVSEADAKRAINAMQRDYDQCKVSGKLSQFQCMLSKLTYTDLAQIALTKAVVAEETKKNGTLDPFSPSNDEMTLIADPFKPNSNAMSALFK